MVVRDEAGVVGTLNLAPRSVAGGSGACVSRPGLTEEVNLAPRRGRAAGGGGACCPRPALTEEEGANLGSLVP